MEVKSQLPSFQKLVKLSTLVTLKKVAYSGIDPRIFQSGKFKATINRITKRGSTRLRQALYTAVQCGLTNNCNSKIKEFYDKKRSEGKPHKVAITTEYRKINKIKTEQKGRLFGFYFIKLNKTLLTFVLKIPLSALALDE